jgi:hypothetical protein
MLNIPAEHPLAVAATAAIRSGDVETLERLLSENPSLATARIRWSRTLLHVATDWPGNFPNSAATIVAVIASSAEVLPVPRRPSTCQSSTISTSSSGINR